MSSSPAVADDLRAKIIAHPDTILDDPDVMRALVAANERMMGGNIVDLRGIAMERLEARLDRLEETHRSVIAAAYENLAGTNQIHRAALLLLEPEDFAGFVATLSGEVAAILRIDCLRLVLESHRDDDAGLAALGEVVQVVPAGFVDAYAGGVHGRTARTVTLRQQVPGSSALYGHKAGAIRSEALLRLDFGTGRLPGMLAMGSEDPQQFAPNQGTDLLTFLAGVFERAMRRFLE
ncbi:DUF484 family protein [Rhodovulum euryhalinum]|uniref:DUF484 family protein n=1 Tax=Rhodovulum euryhalinum TaxID=35805 RepID=A0A4R2KWW6_9RHOB|nr:DUF484 family protein [Rhodovulum euryhalinum]TCO71185.1 hypothetical protein EV655_10778 [Rhodovulum euryhalinum]